MALPLEGIKVLDLSQLLPGSLCTQILADLGAQVLKIENPKAGDGFRWTPPLVKTLGSFFHVTNRNKQGMKLNLRDPAGREIFLKMVPQTDVLLDNFRPGAMQRMGLGYDDLKKINPRLIYCSLTGFGQTGPYRDRAAHDLNFLSIAGVLDLLGEKGGRPIVPAVQMAGAGGGSLNAALGILASLFRRERTGAGQYLDVAILDGLNPFIALTMSQYLANGQLPKRGETLVGGGYAFYNVYETKDGKFLALGALEEKFWQEFCKAIGREDLIAEQFVPSPRQDAVIEEVRGIMMQKTRQEWEELLSQYDTCFSPVNTAAEALQDPQVQHRALWFLGQHPVDGEVGQMNFPVKFSEDQPGWRMPPPSFGEHTEKVLKELGYSDTEIADLAERGII